MGQSIGRAVGNTGWGWLADRYGRKPAFMLGVIWFAVFSALTGLSHHFYVLMAVQFMFGIGFGGEWTASAALLMESVPAWTRPMASALMMSGYEVGYFVAAGVQALVLPHYGWRVLFFIGLAPPRWRCSSGSACQRVRCGFATAKHAWHRDERSTRRPSYVRNSV